MTNYLNYLQNHIKFTLKNANKKNVILGLSCGLDSVLVLKILYTVLNEKNIYVYFIDINSTQDKKYLEIVQNMFPNILINYVNLTNLYDEMIQKLNIINTISQNNIKSKLRSIYLYNKALELNGLVVSTINYSEYFTGFFTKYGDSNADMFIINGLTKKYVIELSKLLSIDQKIIQRNPTPGFSEDDFDENELGIKYLILDEYIENFDFKNEFIEKIVQKNLHKRNLIKPFLLKTYKKYRE